MPDGKSLMIDTQQVHDRRVDIVNRGWMLSIQWLESPLVTWSDTDSPADSTTAQPIRKAKRIVVPTAPSLRRRHPTEFGGPQDECILKHPPLFQVTNQRRGASSHPRRQWPVIPLDVLMRIPITSRKTVIIAGPDLDKTHSTLQQPARDQALSPKVFRFFFRVDLSRILTRVFRNSILFEEIAGLVPNIKGLRRRKLHLRRQFITPNTGLKARIASSFVHMFAIENFKKVLSFRITLSRREPAILRK